MRSFIYPANIYDSGTIYDFIAWHFWIVKYYWLVKSCIIPSRLSNMYMHNLPSPSLGSYNGLLPRQSGAKLLSDTMSIHIKIQLFIQGNKFENAIWETVPILSLPQCVKFSVSSQELVSTSFPIRVISSQSQKYQVQPCYIFQTTLVVHNFPGMYTRPVFTDSSNFISPNSLFHTDLGCHDQHLFCLSIHL